MCRHFANELRPGIVFTGGVKSIQIRINYAGKISHIISIDHTSTLALSLLDALQAPYIHCCNMPTRVRLQNDKWENWVTMDMQPQEHYSIEHEGPVNVKCWVASKLDSVSFALLFTIYHIPTPPTFNPAI